MLALYDSDRNALQLHSAALSQTELYERLLMSFAEREALKTAPALTEEQLVEAAKEELTQLSIVAFAMFNRGQQWIGAADLDTDLAALTPDTDTRSSPTGLRAHLTAAQLLLGRFFFVHEARASREGRTLSTYEFLHATFGEYLVARLATQELHDLAESVRYALRRSRPSALDDAFLYALLSFMPLTTRGTITSFLVERLRSWPQSLRTQTLTLLLSLFHRALLTRHDARYHDYTPQRVTLPARPATYSLNLMLLAAATATAEGLNGDDLFPDSGETVAAWRRLALLWRSQCPAEGWSGLIASVAVDRFWDDGRRQIRVRLQDDSEAEPWSTDPFWTYDFGPDHEYRPRTDDHWFAWNWDDNRQLQQQAKFLCDVGDDILAHGMQPWAGAWDMAVVSFHATRDRPVVSAANALVRLWLKSDQDSAPADLTATFDLCLQIALNGFAPFDADTRRRFRLVFLRRLAADWERLEHDWVERAMRAIHEGGKDSRDEGPQFLEAAREILPAPLALLWPDGQ